MGNLEGKWQRISQFCKGNGVGAVPNQCPEGGLIIDGIRKRRFGAWIMPNNSHNGMLENFCHDLVPSERIDTWNYAKRCVDEAKRLGAPFKNTHTSKSQIHTWLAWQDPPGERMGSAIAKRILNAKLGGAPQFSQWLKTLYGLL